MNDVKFRYWTTQEERDLEHEMRLKTPLHQIATSHGRSEKAISMRFATILQKKLSSNDKDKKQLMQDFSLSPRDLEYYLTMESSTFAKSSDPSGNFDARIQTLEKKIVKLENIIKKLYNKVVQK